MICIKFLMECIKERNFKTSRHISSMDVYVSQENKLNVEDIGK